MTLVKLDCRIYNAIFDESVMKMVFQLEKSPDYD